MKPAVYTGWIPHLHQHTQLESKTLRPQTQTERQFAAQQFEPAESFQILLDPTKECLTCPFPACFLRSKGPKRTLNSSSLNAKKKKKKTQQQFGSVAVALNLEFLHSSMVLLAFFPSTSRHTLVRSWMLYHASGNHLQSAIRHSLFEYADYSLHCYLLHQTQIHQMLPIACVMTSHDHHTTLFYNDYRRQQTKLSLDIAVQSHIDRVQSRFVRELEVHQ
mmetsp:Transcript_10068/g.18142  ORF Transcript_10068/g.18142 Transcript_10068/m.18142 type:complete len:219 (-) Transcript_10068:344-1000(-)